MLVDCAHVFVANVRAQLHPLLVLCVHVRQIIYMYIVYVTR